MTTQEPLRVSRRLDIRLEPDGDRLTLDAPASIQCYAALPAELSGAGAPDPP